MNQLLFGEYWLFVVLANIVFELKVMNLKATSDINHTTIWKRFEYIYIHPGF